MKRTAFLFWSVIAVVLVFGIAQGFAQTADNKIFKGKINLNGTAIDSDGTLGSKRAQGEFYAKLCLSDLENECGGYTYWVQIVGYDKKTDEATLISNIEEWARVETCGSGETAYYLWLNIGFEFDADDVTLYSSNLDGAGKTGLNKDKNIKEFKKTKACFWAAFDNSETGTTVMGKKCSVQMKLLGAKETVPAAVSALFVPCPVLDGM